MSPDAMTPEERAIYDRLPPSTQRSIDGMTPETAKCALSGFANANPQPYRRPRPKVNPRTTPNRTAVDPHPDRRLPPERDDEDDGRFGPRRV